jgi:hypothetical protein
VSAGSSTAYDPTLPRPWLEEYNENFVAWEPAFFDLAHEHGVFDKYKVAPSARPALVTLWRRVEGGGA